jgi:hypothetical protein
VGGLDTETMHAIGQRRMATLCTSNVCFVRRTETVDDCGTRESSVQPVASSGTSLVQCVHDEIG